MILPYAGSLKHFTTVPYVTIQDINYDGSSNAREISPYDILNLPSCTVLNPCEFNHTPDGKYIHEHATVYNSVYRGEKTIRLIVTVVVRDVENNDASDDEGNTMGSKGNVIAAFKVVKDEQNIRWLFQWIPILDIIG